MWAGPQCVHYLGRISGQREQGGHRRVSALARLSGRGVGVGCPGGGWPRGGGAGTEAVSQLVVYHTFFFFFWFSYILFNLNIKKIYKDILYF